MFHKTFIHALITTFMIGVVFGQTPEPKKDSQRIVREFTWSLDGDGSYLGVQTQEISKENFAKFGLREVRGVAVEKVLEGSPAQASGLRNGDVIVRFNGEEVTSSRKLTRLVGEVAPDHAAKLTVLRGGSEREITVTVGKRPTPKFATSDFSFNFPDGLDKLEIPQMPPMADAPGVRGVPPPRGPGEFLFRFGGSGRRIGVGITPLTEQLAEHFGVVAGVMINDVRADSPAAKAGMKAGDIIVEADAKEVKNEGDLVRAIAEKKEGDVLLTVVHDRNRQTISVTPEESKDEIQRFFEFKRDGSEPVQPARPAPLPLNQLFLPGRVI